MMCSITDVVYFRCSGEEACWGCHGVPRPGWWLGGHYTGQQVRSEAPSCSILRILIITMCLPVLWFPGMTHPWHLLMLEWIRLVMQSFSSVVWTALVRFLSHEDLNCFENKYLGMIQGIDWFHLAMGGLFLHMKDTLHIICDVCNTLWLWNLIS